MLPAQICSDPSASPLGDGVGQVAVFDHAQPSIHFDNIPHAILRVLLGDHLAGQLGPGEQVVAEKFGGADLDQRIVDLEVEDLLDASLGQLRQRPAGLEGRQRAAVPIGAEGDLAALGQQDLAGPIVDGGHRTLAENPQVGFRQAEIRVLREKSAGLPFGCRADHQIDGNRGAIAASRRHHLLQVNLEDRAPRHRPDGKHPLGMLEAEPRPLAAGNQEDGHAAAGQRSAPRRQADSGENRFF